MRRQHVLFILCFVLFTLISTGCDTSSSTVSTSTPAPQVIKKPSPTGESLPPPVVIDPGHGGEETGAIGWNTGVPEKEIVLNIALHVKKVLEDEGVRVVMTRESDRMHYPSDDTKEDLRARASLAAEIDARLFVSIHADQFDETVHGSKVFYSELNPYVEESERLAHLVLEELTGHIQSKSLGVHGEDYIVLRENKVPAILIETGFVSHKQEEEKLINPEYQDKAGDGIAQGILRYLKEQDSLTDQ